MKTATLKRPKAPVSGFRRKAIASSAGLTLLEQLAKFDGVLQDAPADLALNHDHYRLGLPKRNGR